MIYNINEMAKTNSDNNFALYTTSSLNKNVLFLGSCRMSPLMYYWHIMYPKYNIYNIYVPNWTDRSKIDKKRIQSILENTDFLITETVRNFEILNTDRSIDNNFFKVFDVNAQEIRISNLELHMYVHDLCNVYKVPEKNYQSWFENSKNRLRDSLISKNQGFIWEFIKDNLQEIRMFATHNHPTNILSIATFIFIARQLNDKINLSFIEKVFDKLFLQGHYTPIVELDIDLYNFKFEGTVFPNTILSDSSYRHTPPSSETTPSIKTIEKLFNYI